MAQERRTFEAVDAAGFRWTIIAVRSTSDTPRVDAEPARWRMTTPEGVEVRKTGEGRYELPDLGGLVLVAVHPDLSLCGRAAARAAVFLPPAARSHAGRRP